MNESVKALVPLNRDMSCANLYPLPLNAVLGGNEQCKDDMGQAFPEMRCTSLILQHTGALRSRRALFLLVHFSLP